MAVHTIEHYLEVNAQLIGKRLDELVPAGTEAYQALIAAARYSLLGGGKRLRPILTLAAAEALRCPLEAALDTACAIEMIHTYSLIHDDLPCMDNDDLRRGKPTLHKAYSEAHAVLAGDFLLTRAFEVLAQDERLSAEQRLTLIQLCAARSGAKGMVGGQLIDLEAEGRQLDCTELNAMHRLKTGALISASLIAGGVIAQAGGNTLAALDSFGQDIGLAFQIIDDVIDMTSTTEELGKNARSDEANDKSTYVKLMGLEGAKRAAKELIDRSVGSLENASIATVILKELAYQCINRTK